MRRLLRLLHLIALVGIIAGLLPPHQASAAHWPAATTDPRVMQAYVNYLARKGSPPTRAAMPVPIVQPSVAQSTAERPQQSTPPVIALPQPSITCNPIVGAGASTITATNAIASADGRAAGSFGCPDGLVSSWDGGTEVQYFASGTKAIIYVPFDPFLGTAYFIDAPYLAEYQSAGGPGGWLGLPRSDSNIVPIPSYAYQDETINFTGDPIQKFAGGFIGRANSTWMASRYFPDICDVQTLAVYHEEGTKPTPQDPNPVIPYRNWRELTVTIGGVVDPGDSGASEQFDTLALRVYNDSTGTVSDTNLVQSGNQFVTDEPLIFGLSDALRFYAIAYRSDGRRGYAPANWYESGNTATHTIPPGYGIHTFTSCNSTIWPPDTEPPVIHTNTLKLEQDGRGNVYFEVKITDNRRVDTAVLTIDGINYNLQPLGGSYYGLAVYGLSLGVHRYHITATDPVPLSDREPDSGERTFFIERSDAHGVVPWQGYSPDPVNTAIGNYIYRYLDIKLIEHGPDLEIMRFFNAQRHGDGYFGVGWTSLLDMQLRLMDNRLFRGAILTLPDGRTLNFARQADGSFDRPENGFDRLIPVAGGYLLSRTDDTHYLFASDGRLTNIEDASGDGLVITYSGSLPALIRATVSGRELRFTPTPDGQHIGQLDGPEGISIKYEYDDLSDRLMRVIDSNSGIVTYHYDGDYGLARIETPRGDDQLAEQKFDASGRVIYQRVGTGFQQFFAYSPDGRTVTMTDTLSNTMVHRYDQQARLIEVQDADGSERYNYNNAYQRTSVTDRNGNLTTYNFDGLGDIVTLVDPIGGVSRYTYDSAHRLLSATDPLSRTTSYTYDGVGRQLSETDALSRTTTYQYDPSGRLIAQFAPGGQITRFAHDVAGNRSEQIDAMGGVSRYTYDGLGRLRTETDPNGARTTYAYDGARNLQSEIDALGGETRSRYDANNNRVSETDPNGNITSYSYNDLDKLSMISYPDGGITTIGYDPLGHRSSETDPTGATRSWLYGPTYRVIAEINPLGNHTAYTYDRNGNRTEVIDPRGFVTRYTYDKRNRVTEITDPLGGVTYYSYDAVGNRSSVTDPNGNLTQYSYDALDRLVLIIDALGNRTEYSYDLSGDQVLVRDALGGERKMSYDALGRLVSMTDQIGATTSYSYDGAGNRIATTSPRGDMTLTEYDALGRPTAVTDAHGQTTRIRYDRVGNPIEVIDALGGSTRTSYDPLNRPVELIDALGSRTSTSYDLAGRRVGLTDARGSTSFFRYDAAGRLTGVQDPLGFNEQYLYDAAGNQVALIDKHGRSTVMEYNALNQVVARTDPLGRTVRLSYDPAGNQIGALDPMGNHSVTAYDALNRPVLDINPLGQPLRTEYDPLGHPVRQIFADGSSIARQYNAVGQLTAEADGEGRIRQFAYDATGNQIKLIDATGQIVETIYDGLNRPIESRDSIGIIEQRAYDALGRPLRVTDGNGQTTTLAYDPLGRLVEVTDPAGHTTTMAYDAIGNQIGLTNGNGHTINTSYDLRNQPVAITDGNGHTRSISYNAAGQQLIESDALGISTLKGYDESGQLISITRNYRPSVSSSVEVNVTTRLSYNLNGDLVGIANPNGAVNAFEVDALGRRVAEIDPLGNRTSYRYDEAGRITERNDPNGVTVRSAYDRSGRLLETRYPDESAVRRSYDQRGDLAQIEAAMGSVSFSYDSRGRPVAEAGPHGTIAYAYDNANNRTAISYPDGATVTYGYGANSWLAQVRLPGGAATSYERDGIGQVLLQRDSDGTVTKRSYDRANNLVQLESRQDGRLIAGVAYEYDAVNQRSQATFSQVGRPAVTERYIYDPLMRLVAASDSTGVQTSYRYDAAGNRLSWRTNDDPRTAARFDRLALSYSYDAADQLISAVDGRGRQTSYRYDTLGNRVEQTEALRSTSYRYDFEQRLLELSSGNSRATMAYDGLGRRAEKREISFGREQTSTYLYVGFDPIGEIDNGVLTRLYRGDGGQVIAQARGASEPQWYTHDGLGSTIGLRSNERTVAYHYDAYGIAREGSGAAVSFTGQEYDRLSKVYHFHARDYDPAAAVWLTRDPYRGTIERPQSLHRYGYVEGNPINAIDEYGYSAKGQFSHQGEGYGAKGFSIKDLPNGEFYNGTLKLITGVDLDEELQQFQDRTGFTAPSWDDLKEIANKLKTRQLFKRSLLPDGLKDLPLVKPYASYYLDFRGEFDISSNLEKIGGSSANTSGLKASFCANLSAGVEVGAIVKSQIRTFVVHAYGQLDFDLEACADLLISSTQTDMSGKLVFFTKLRGKARLHAALGLRLYAEIDIGMTGVRAGVRIELNGELNASLDQYNGLEHGIKAWVEGGPFMGYKPWRWWGGDTQWVDKELFTLRHDIPLPLGG